MRGSSPPPPPRPKLWWFVTQPEQTKILQQVVPNPRKEYSGTEGDWAGGERT